jgi:hypothetical protein
VAGRGLPLALLLILPAAVPGAAAEASLQVRVVDASHRALPEVSATLVSIDEAGAAYTARAEAGGVLAFYDLGPGAYRLRVEHAGLAPVSSDLRLGPGETGWLTAVLAGGEGSSRIDDLLPEPGRHGTTFDADALRDLPSSRDAWSLLETAPPSPRPPSASARPTSRILSGPARRCCSPTSAPSARSTCSRPSSRWRRPDRDPCW